MRRIVLLPAFSPETWLQLVAQESVTNVFLVPTMLSRIVDKLDDKTTAGLSSLRAIAYGGGQMPLELIKRALDLFPNTEFTNAYGLTETSSTIALLGHEEHRLAQTSEDCAVRARLASVGRPLPTVELEIRDSEAAPFPPVNTVKSMFVVIKYPGSTVSAALSMPTAGFPHAMRAGWMRRVTFFSPVALTT